jgi:hypothetical protein
MPPESADKPGETKVILRFTLNLDSPFGQLQRAVMRMVDLVSFGLSVAQQTELAEPPRLPDVFVQLQLGSRLPLEKLPAEFGIWTLGSGLRDMIEALEPFLDEVWKISWALKTHAGGPDGPRTRDEIVGVLQDLEKGHAEFREFHVAKKLSQLLEEEPTLLPREWKIAFFSIIGLRNCLVHRRGVVGQRDCDVEGTMTVTWRETRALIEYEDGTREPLYVGMTTEREGMALLRRSWKETKFRPGDQVRLETQDFADIALTLFFGALHMRDAFLEKIKALGIEAVEPQTATATASDTTE